MRHDGPARVEIISILDERQSASITIQQNAHDVAGPVVRAIQSFGPEGLRRPIIDKANARPARGRAGRLERRRRAAARADGRHAHKHGTPRRALDGDLPVVPSRPHARRRQREAAAAPRRRARRRQQVLAYLQARAALAPIQQVARLRAAGPRRPDRGQLDGGPLGPTLSFEPRHACLVGVLPRLAHAPPPPRLARAGGPRHLRARRLAPDDVVLLGRPARPARRRHDAQPRRAARQSDALGHVQRSPGRSETDLRAI